MSPLNQAARLIVAALAAACLGGVGAGCTDRSTSYTTTTGPLPPPVRTVLDPREDLPGLNIVVVSVAAGTSPTGTLRAGDPVSFTFRLERDDGQALALAEVDSMGALLSGPTDNYQLVLPLARDVRDLAVDNGDGTYTYTFADPIPAEYPPPLNDTPAFGLADGELQGEPLRDGTYTIGLQAAKDYTIEGQTYRDAASTVEHVLLGSARRVTPRAVVGNDNCNACHTELQAHGGGRLNVDYCVTCHTSGAEDEAGASIDFRVMVHRIHAGATLPSVLGVTTRSDGSRDYAAAPVPLVIGGHDYSNYRFPSWPHLTHPMPRDAGFGALTSGAGGQQALENTMRSGPTSCDACHGDPDGAGAIVAPEQGAVSRSQPTRRACGACHDDVVWSHPYVANGQTMPPQTDDASCITCHAPSGDLLAVLEAHEHPMLVADPGVVVAVQGVVEAGTNDGDGTFDPGEKVQVTFTVRDAAGGTWTPTPPPIQGPTSVSFVLSGPLTNRNLLISSSIPVTSATLAAQPFVRNLPEPITLELVGVATVASDVFTVSRGMFYAGTTTTVRERTAITTTVGNGATTTSAASAALDNRVSVVSTTGFAAGNFVVIDAGLGTEEYVEVGLAEGGQLQLRSALRFGHALGATVNRVTFTTRTAGTHYTLNAATGEVIEGPGAFGNNPIVVTYTADYLVPATFNAAPFNDSPDFDETWGEWKGKALVSGTYELGLWARGNFIVTRSGVETSYPSTSRPEVVELAFGSGPAAPAPPRIIDSADSCYACHQDMWFHGGGRRGVETCLLCHGTAGSEDLARFRSAGADATPGVTIDFRVMLHRIHRGKELANAATYGVVGNGPTTHFYDLVGFPAMPGGTKDCATCHGQGNTRWTEPLPRDHPTQQALPSRPWRDACTSCHDSSAAAAHADAQAPLGVESCAVCHGAGAEKDVSVVHKPRVPR